MLNDRFRGETNKSDVKTISSDFLTSTVLTTKVSTLNDVRTRDFSSLRYIDNNLEAQGK